MDISCFSTSLTHHLQEHLLADWFQIKGNLIKCNNCQFVSVLNSNDLRNHPDGIKRQHQTIIYEKAIIIIRLGGCRLQGDRINIIKGAKCTAPGAPVAERQLHITQ